MNTDSIASEEERRKELQAKLGVMATEQQERMARYRAEQMKLPYISLSIFPINVDILEIVPKSEAANANAVLFYKQGNDIRVGAVNPHAEEVAGVLDRLQTRFGHKPQLYVISHRSLQAALSRYRKEAITERGAEDEIRVTESELSQFEEVLVDMETVGKRIASMPPTEILNAMVVGAVKMNASDIHIEPQEKQARLRFRVDGVLQDITEFDRQGWALVLSRVKVLTNLKLNVRDTPQDGSFVLRIGAETFDIRVSILPGGSGENIVMRLLDRKAEVASMESLGMKERDFSLVRTELKRSNGMVLVTGPTGSGKTTTLASFVQVVNHPEIKIITLENPIEYRLPGVEQIEINPSKGLTFASGLRSILRQDPDMILLGEMRDAETAETAVHAALTGHLVFSTLHTNDAAGAVPRLVDMGINPSVLAPSLNVVIAQRLVRIVCAKCSEQYAPDSALRERILDAMQGVRADIFNPADVKNPGLMLVKAKGCKACGNTGYKGRTGVFEIFTVQGEMEGLVLEGADRQRIQEVALRQGMTTIAQDGYLKVLSRITTIEEVERVSSE